MNSDSHEWLEANGLGDAEPPHTPRGCPFQAWSEGGALRLDRVVLADSNLGRRKSNRESQPA